MRSSNDEGRSPVPMDIGTLSVHPAMPAHDEQEGKAEKENSKRQKNNPLGNWNTVVTALPAVPLPQLNHTSTSSFTHNGTLEFHPGKMGLRSTKKTSHLHHPRQRGYLYSAIEEAFTHIAGQDLSLREKTAHYFTLRRDEAPQQKYLSQNNIQDIANKIYPSNAFAILATVTNRVEQMGGAFMLSKNNSFLSSR